jgi:hypothetical protein
MLFITTCSAIAEAPPEGPYFGLTPPGLTPEVFAPGRISLPNRFEEDICFSKDGGECYFTVLLDTSWSDYRIYETHYESGEWTTPAQASFSNNQSIVPSLADNDQSMYFTRDTDVWKAVRSGSGWSSPVNVGAPVSSSYDEWSCHISDLGNAWICSWRLGGTGGCDLWKVQYEDGNFTVAAPLSTLNTTSGDCQPVPGPDEDYVIFNSSCPGGYGKMDLYISFADGRGGWTAPQNLGPTINTSNNDWSAYVSPDHKYLFFSRQVSSTDADIYWVDIHALCPEGDFSCDGRVDFEDMEILAANWLADEPSIDHASPEAPDGIINFREFNLLAGNWRYIPPDLVPPAVPTGLVATAGDSTVSLDWNNNSEPDFNGFNVYRSQTSGSGYTKLNGSLLIDSNYTDNTVINETVYFYVVTAVDTSANESIYSNKVSAISLAPGNIIIQENIAGFCSVDGIISRGDIGYTGFGFCYVNAIGKGINWSISVPSAGTYTLTWRYTLNSGDRPAKLFVNSLEIIPSISFPGTGGWTTWSTGVSVDVSLSADISNIRLESTTAGGLAYIDYIMITGDNPLPAICP